MATMFDYRTIVVGTDGSPLAAPTVSRAAWLAAHNDADLVIVCAYSELSRRQQARSVATLGDTRVGQIPGRAAASSAIAAAVAAAQAQDATISAALLVDGEPASALLTTAKEASR
jgi:nucleotide-binding universal stress UspA family protein